MNINGNAEQTYRGAKTLKAWPMARGEYTAYRGWNAPEGEDQSVPGYLVEYAAEDGETPNVPGHLGYVSWSPANVFERTYQPIPADWRERVAQESAALAGSLEALRRFRHTSTFADLGQSTKELLAEQELHMGAYLDVLARRMQEAPAEDAPVIDEDFER